MSTTRSIRAWRLRAATVPTRWPVPRPDEGRPSAAAGESGGLVVHPASGVRLLRVWRVTWGAGLVWGGCDDPSGARVERGGGAQAGADDALTETGRGAGPACADYPARD